MGPRARHPWEERKERALPFLRQTFEDAPALLKRYTSAQVAEGLWYLCGEFAGGYVGASLKGPASLAQKLALLRAIEGLFTGFFPKALRRSENMRTTCLMWWDIDSLFWENGKALVPRVRAEVLACQSRLLKAPGKEARQAAIHGLGHWLRAGACEPRAVLRRYLRGEQDRHLRDYAQSALDLKMM